jgi:hypothetical protein
MQRRVTVFLAATVISVFLIGCASKPIVDTYNVDMVQYQKDLAECEDIARQVDSGQIALSSAAFGAGVGAAFGAIGGEVGVGAATGAVSGGAGGLLRQDDEKANVAKNCLRYRGYAVLN